jgi:hypothetical protein
MKSIEHHESPHDALIKALERVEDMESVLIVYEGKPGLAAGSFDSDISVEKAVWLVEIFKFWLLTVTVSPKD